MPKQRHYFKTFKTGKPAYVLAYTRAEAIYKVCGKHKENFRLVSCWYIGTTEALKKYLKKKGNYEIKH